ncbi:MAG: hypothetical protein ABSH20_01730 [Tepidisphaeraceae bacterium]|jgi:RecB family endonuclease NucS
MASRIIVRIELTAQAKAAVEKLTGTAGMTQVSMLSRVVEWLARQSSAVQASILGQYASETKGETARLILKDMTSGKQS